MNRELEESIQTIGHQLWAEMQSRSDTGPRGWIDRLLAQLLTDDHLRLQGLRFVDTVPLLTDDTQLVNHFREYFSAIDDHRLPPLLAWGIRRSTKLALPAVMAPVIRTAVRQVAHRFIAGEDADGILGSVVKLQGRGVRTSLDMLGEATVSEAEAQGYQQAYLDLIARVSESGKSAVLESDLNLSVKVSSLYSQISAVDTEGSIRQLAERLRPICNAAMAAGFSVTLDMEQYDYKAIILQLFKQLAMEEPFRQWDGLGIVIQAYLCDADSDLADLIGWVEMRGTPIMVRLVRGAYWDMETVIAQQQGWPIPVWTNKDDTDACYERCLVRLFESALIRPAVATHNLRSIACAMALSQSTGRGPDDYEFQMLYGMSDALEPLLTERDLTLRLYLPFGELLQGIAYLVRRLLENSSDQSILPLMPSLDIAQILQPPQPRDVDETPVVTGFVNQPLHRFTQHEEREKFAATIASVEKELGKTYPLMLSGHIALQEQAIDSTNPADPTQLIGRVVSGGADDAEMALRLTLSATRDWRELSFNQRADYLDRIAGALADQRDWFAAWEVKEAGKGWAEADADVAEAIDFLQYYAHRARKLDGGYSPSLPGEENHLNYQPLGIGVILPPWNFPLAIPVGMLSAAIVCGNCVILKPASQTPVVAWHFCQLLQEIGLPEGVVTCLPGSGAEIGEALVRDPRTHFVAFTGSKEVGLHLHKLMSEITDGQRHIKRLIAEMGGKNAIIIDADADLDDAVTGVIDSAFGYQGQKCSACSRVICVDSIHDRFVSRLTEATRSLCMGDPKEPGSRIGPVISEEAKQRIMQHIEEAKITAKPHFIGGWEPNQAHYIAPVIFTDVEEESALSQEEIFGPVLAVMRAKDFTDALRIANSTAYALTGGLYSRLPSHLEQAKREFAVGNLYINRKITRAMVYRQPFGGFRLSGMGFKAGGPDYLLQFLQARNVTENTLRRGFAPSNLTTGD
ncbi:proline dehydrogenase family protein [Candidatus Thiodiazotropha sp. CDECU1]|uniref:proline dehydrogenase family protein n=1 Tax=Candidatus Thiodiazotropha sp. CDECU1 TaxID=3065865 RepID=UPI00292D7215|nr:proline dehydrogenase family protein [Candidatus Thiodiazotropha sp. CDECU1]